MQDFFVYPVWDRKRTAFRSSFCDPCRIQTCNPHIRSVVLYSVELMDPEVSYSPYCASVFSKAGAKVLLFFELCKFFGKKMRF